MTLAPMLLASLLGAAQSTGQMSPTSSLDNNRVKATGSTTSRALKDRFADVANVKDFGATCDGTTNDTAAFDRAIATGRTLYLPSGTCRYSATPASYVDVTGPGKVLGATAMPHPYFHYRIGSTGLTSDQVSYLGIVTRDYEGDNGSRLYIMPKTEVTSGVGGAIKVFADPYFLGTAYRDLGIYFNANQDGWTGHNGTGAFWMNLKNGPLTTSTYGKNSPDLCWSINDGALVGGCMMRFDPGGASDRVHWFFGKPVAGTDPAILNGVKIIAEFQKGIGFGRKGYGVSWMTSSNFADTKIATDDTGNRLEFEWAGTRRGYMGSNGWNFEGRVVEQLTTVTAGDTLDLAQTNVVVLSHVDPTDIGTLSNGAAGQTVRFICGTGNATVKNTASVKLAGATDFTCGTNDTLTITSSGTVWYEMSRSNN